MVPLAWLEHAAHGLGNRALRPSGDVHRPEALYHFNAARLAGGG